MALKKSVKKPETNVGAKISELKERIKNNDSEVERLNEETDHMYKEITELELLPFKLGDEVIASVPAGRNYKEQKCVLEYSSENRCPMVRPYKGDGELSNRVFRLYTDPSNKEETYKDLLKKA